MLGPIERSSATRSTSSSTTTARLQVAGQLGDRADADQRAAGKDKPGVAGHLAEQVAGGVRLAGARRAVEQQAALEVLAGGEQRFPVRGDAERVPLHPGEHGIREHHVVAAQARRRRRR